MDNETETIEFRHNSTIHISLQNAKIYADTYACEDESALKNSTGWHQIVIKHAQLNDNEDYLLDMASRQKIITSIFRAVEDELFFPVGYRCGLQEDRFLVRDCALALKRLFAKKLRVPIEENKFVELELQLNVATYEFGHMSPHNLIAMTLDRMFDQLETINGKRGILNVNNFASKDDFLELIVNLSNKSVLNTVCNMILKNDAKFHLLRGITFANNEIKHLDAFSVFGNCRFTLLDLTNNEISYDKRIIKTLQMIKVQEICLEHNPLTVSSHYPACMEPVLNNFKFIDGIKSNGFLKDYVRKTVIAASSTVTAVSNDSNVDACSKFYRIDYINMSDIEKFEQSLQWHAIVIPDLQEQYSKEDIINYLFLRISISCEEFYPCSYKFENSQHKFLVRNCFEQLKYLTLKAKLKISLPNLINSTTETIMFHLIMNISEFKEGQIVPAACISNAVRKRICANGRLFNLEDFQNTPGLEDVVVNMSNAAILTRVFVIMSQQPEFRKCTRLVLSNNKILNVNVISDYAHLMPDLHTVNLSFNWIYNIRDIEGLTAVNQLKHLMLEGNPIYSESEYDQPIDFVKAIEKLLPNLETLEYNAIKQHLFVNSKRSYINDISKFDLVEQFVPRYFKTYDSSYRCMLQGVYHKNAIFTLTTHFGNGIAAEQIAFYMQNYLSYSRNTLGDNASANHTNVFYGHTKIMQAFAQLPSTKHDVLNFNVDVIVRGQLTFITVHGCFMDLQQTNELLLSFTRNLLLMPVASRSTGCGQCYEIFNDMLSISLPSENQRKNAFRIEKSIDTFDLKDQIERQRILMAMLQELTNLKTVWIQRILEDSDWNFKAAVELFMKKCANNEIVDTAFQNT